MGSDLFSDTSDAFIDSIFEDANNAPDPIGVVIVLVIVLGSILASLGMYIFY